MFICPFPLPPPPHPAIRCEPDHPALSGVHESDFTVPSLTPCRQECASHFCLPFTIALPLGASHFPPGLPSTLPSGMSHLPLGARRTGWACVVRVCCLLKCLQQGLHRQSFCGPAGHGEPRSSRSSVQPSCEANPYESGIAGTCCSEGLLACSQSLPCGAHIAAPCA